MRKEEFHPLALAFDAALQQAVGGKGQRHGGGRSPFYDQQWRTLAECHGDGFLTGQAAKKLNEVGGKSADDIEGREREILGAMVYAGMAWLKLKGYPEAFETIPPARLFDDAAALMASALPGFDPDAADAFAAEAAGWRPMSEAPRNGDFVELLSVQGHLDVRAWVEDVSVYGFKREFGPGWLNCERRSAMVEKNFKGWRPLQNTGAPA